MDREQVMERLTIIVRMIQGGLDVNPLDTPEVVAGLLDLVERELEDIRAMVGQDGQGRPC
jgi:hypothetical protein